MTWLTVKHLLQKLWTYIKNYWWAGALIIIGFVLHKFFVKDKDFFRSLYEGKVKQNEEEIKVLNDSHEEEVKEKPKRRYTKTGSEKPKVVEKKETTKKKKPRKSRKSKKETGELDYPDISVCVS